MRVNVIPFEIGHIDKIVMPAGDPAPDKETYAEALEAPNIKNRYSYTNSK